MHIHRAALAAALVVAGLGFPAAAAAHGGPHLYQSVIKGIEPPEAGRGVEVRMIDFDSQVEVINRSGKTVTVAGYEGEPYARIVSSGPVYLNARSPSMAPSNDRLGKTRPTGNEDAAAPPNWIKVGEGGRFRWFDRRTQFRKTGLPAAVTDETRRTLVWSWQIPIRVGRSPAEIRGDLIWLGRRPFPTGIFLVILFSTAACGLFGAWALKRMREQDQDAEPDEGGPA